MTLAAAPAAPEAAPSSPAEPGPLPRLRGMTVEEIAALLAEGGHPAYRAKQVFQWVHRHGVRDFAEMTTLAKSLRAWLAERAEIGGPELVEAPGPPEGTRKAVFRLRDGRFVEGVLMRDEGKGRTSLCVSSQAGCAVGCTFCLTGYGGFQRNLTADEIAGQVLEIRRRLFLPGEIVHGLVFMGMGEPMFNLEAVIQAIRVLGDDEGAGLSPRRMTVSTSGVIPGIEAFGAAGTGANLAVSLNATEDRTRTAIMPLNKRWPIAELLAALKRFPLAPRQRITIEYVLLKGVNDAPADAKRLTELLRGLRCKVNLIMFNRHELLDYEPVSEATLEFFTRTLANAQYTVSVRWSKGREIEAACGQLAAHHFRKAEPAISGPAPGASAAAGEEPAK